MLGSGLAPLLMARRCSETLPAGSLLLEPVQTPFTGAGGAPVDTARKLPGVLRFISYRRVVKEKRRWSTGLKYKEID